VYTYISHMHTVLCCSEVSEGGSLSLTSVTRHDAGVYSCHADNGVPPAASKRTRLDIICMSDVSSLLQ